MLSDMVQNPSFQSFITQDFETVSKRYYFDLFYSCTALPGILNRSFTKSNRWFYCQQNKDVILSHIVFRGKKCTTGIISLTLP